MMTNGGAEPTNADIARRRRTADVAAATTTDRQEQEQQGEPMDESDQMKVVTELRSHTINVTNELCNVVVMACLGAGVLTVSTPLLIEYIDSINEVDAENPMEVASERSLLNHIYTAISLLGHLQMAYIGQQTKIPTNWTPSFPIRTSSTHRSQYIIAISFVIGEFLLMLYIINAKDHISMGQFIGNICTLIAALFVAMDSISTEDVLRKHDGSRYGFKSL